MLKPMIAAVSLLSLSSQTLAQSAPTVSSEVSSQAAANIKTGISGSQSLNRLDVNGAKSSRVAYKRFGAFGQYNLSRIELGLQAEHLNREREDFSTATNFEKDTQIYAPSVAFYINNSLALHAGHSIYVTDAELNAYENKTYSQNATRSNIGFTATSGTNSYLLALHSELRSEQDYAVGPYPLVDREYVPAQVKFAWANNTFTRTTVHSGITYSHYNNDVYKDQYESDVPTTPTLAQVFDYLLTLKVGAAISLSPKWTVAVDALRKAALDVNSFTGDEYVLSYIGNSEVTHEVRDAVSLSVGMSLSNGQKTHEVQSQSYKYTSRVESYGAKLTANL